MFQKQAHEFNKKRGKDESENQWRRRKKENERLLWVGFL
jgi:hypothetical protein